MAAAVKGHRAFGLPVKEYGVGKYAKLLERILKGRSDANIRFSDLVQLLLHRSSTAKLYQVRQVRNVILRYGLGADENE